MADANVSKLGVTAAAASEAAAAKAEATTEAAIEAPVVATSVETEVHPFVNERRIVGKYEVKTARGDVIVVENL